MLAYPRCALPLLLLPPLLLLLLSGRACAARFFSSCRMLVSSMGLWSAGRPNAVTTASATCWK
jgi:hypothetical protein